MRHRLWLGCVLVGAIACGTTETGTTGGSGQGASPSPDGGGGGAGGNGGTPAQARVIVQFTGGGAGRVTSNTGGLDCPGTCSVTVAPGTVMTLSAAPDGNSTFVGWGGACSGPICTLTANGDQTAWANFETRAPPPPPPASSCKGINPPDAPRMLQFVDPPGMLSRSCGDAVGDASGTLAIVLNGAHGDAVDLISASSGKFLGQGGMSMFGFPLQQPKGVTVVSGRPYLGPSWAIQFGQMISNFDSAGHGAGVSVLANHSGKVNLPAAADPNGGVLLAGDLAMAPDDPVIHAAVMYEGNASSPSVRWGPRLLASSGAVFGLGVDVLGRSLVITDGAPRFGGGNISAQWFDRNGAALTGEFVLLTGLSAGSSTWFETTALIGGGVLVRRMDAPSHAQALVVVESGSAIAKAAPGWMASRRDVKLQIAPSGKAYAAMPVGASGVSCTQRVEVLAPDGASCGATDYAIAAGTCDTLELKLAADGTIIQPLPTAMEKTNDIVGGHTCTWRWWPQALR